MRDVLEGDPPSPECPPRGFYAGADPHPGEDADEVALDGFFRDVEFLGYAAVVHVAGHEREDVQLPFGEPLRRVRLGALSGAPAGL